MKNLANLLWRLSPRVRKRQTKTALDGFMQEAALEARANFLWRLTCIRPWPYWSAVGFWLSAKYDSDSRIEGVSLTPHDVVFAASFLE